MMVVTPRRIATLLAHNLSRRVKHRPATLGRPPFCAVVRRPGRAIIALTRRAAAAAPVVERWLHASAV
jgi:hypothetical protein